MVPVVCGALVLTIRERPALVHKPNRILDATLIVWLVIAAATLMPLPAGVRFAIAPHAPAVDRALFFSAPTDPATALARPLSMDPEQTTWAVAVAIAILLVFWCARAVVARSGLREMIRSIAWMGLAVSALTLIQHATSPRLLYWYWRPVARLATPFGPFVNRNDLATWLIMAIPATIGYGVARFESRRGNTSGFDLEQNLDPTALWLAGSVCFMLGTLVVTMSRAGLAGAIVGLTCLMWLARGRIAGSGWRWLAAILLVLVAIAATYGNWAQLAQRVDETMAYGLAGRREIWRLTWRIVTDFPLLGVGLGAYPRAMSVYQPVPHVFYFNNAHSQYLQLLTEGGVVLVVPVAIATAAAIWRIATCLRADRTPVFWVRAGAASGLVAVAVQAVWQVVLIPAANGVLFAILAAVAMHEARSSMHEVQSSTHEARSSTHEARSSRREARSSRRDQPIRTRSAAR